MPSNDYVAGLRAAIEICRDVMDSYEGDRGVVAGARACRVLLWRAIKAIEQESETDVENT